MYYYIRYIYFQAYKDAETVLAQTNAEGYPESLLHDALVKANKEEMCIRDSI